MTEVDLLTVVAEIALGTAGFSGLVAAFTTRSSGPWSLFDRLRLSILLGASLSVVGFSLLPIGLGVAGLSDSLRWALSSGLYLLSYVPILLLWWRNRDVRSEPSTPADRPVTIFVFVQLPVNLVLLGANALVLATAWPHLAALGLQLSLALIMFAVLLFESLPRE